MRKEIKYVFTEEEIENIMEETNKDTPEEALEKWGREMYPLGVGYSIKKVGKTFITIIER